jgi:hypothetical protein
MDAVWKIPLRWSSPGLPDRTTLYPALYLRWAGRKVAVGPRIAPGQWNGAKLRVLVTDGALADDERELLALSAARGLGVVLAPQGGLPAVDRDFAAAHGVTIAALTDPGPLSSPPPRRPGAQIATLTGCAARQAEDIALAALLGAPGQEPVPPGDGGLVVAAGSAAAFGDIRPAIERWSADGGGRVWVTSDDRAELQAIAASAAVTPIDPADPALLQRIAEAEAFLCAVPGAPIDDARPGQWVRSALFQGAPVIAASHPSIDGLAHLCVLDDFERGLKLYRRFPLERMKAAVAGQAALAERLEPARIAGEWLALADRAGAPPRRSPRPAPAPLLLVLMDVFGDLDLMAPVLEALAARGETRLRILVTDWLAQGSPRTATELAARGFDFEIVPREAVRAGEVPSLAGVAGVLTGADASVRAHKAGHVLAGRARAKGLASFTIQHGFENIGLTYKDHLHGEDVRLASEAVFTWSGPEALAPWAASETRAAAVPTGSPKAAPPPARAAPLNQGYWPRVVGVFENLHWHRFSDAYRDQALADLQAAAEAHEDTLFLVKPHHAGRWLSIHRERLPERPNLVIVDPTDSAWEPHTAPALMAGMDAVLTTPSTVALDAARTGRPVAVLGYDLELPLYQPLPIIRSLAELQAFLSADEADGLLLNEAFLRRATLPGRADHRIAARIAEALREPAPSGGTVLPKRQRRAT